MPQSGKLSVQLHFCLGEYKGHEDHACFAALKRIRRDDGIYTSRLILTTDWICHRRETTNQQVVTSFSFHKNALQENNMLEAEIQCGDKVVCATRYPTHPRCAKQFDAQHHMRLASHVCSVIRSRWCVNFETPRKSTFWRGQLYAVVEITMRPSLDIIDNACRLVRKHKSDCYMYFRKKSRNLPFSLCPMICCPMHEATPTVDKMKYFSRCQHFNVRFERKHFNATLCRTGALPLPLMLWAKINRFLLQTTEHLVLHLHALILWQDAAAAAAERRLIQSEEDCTY